MFKDINSRRVITELVDIIKLRRLLINPGQKYGHFTLKYYSVGIFEAHFTDEILDINLYRSINKEILSSISTSSTKSRSPSTRCFHEMCAKKCNSVLTAVHISGEETPPHFSWVETWTFTGFVFISVTLSLICFKRRYPTYSRLCYGHHSCCRQLRR